MARVGIIGGSGFDDPTFFDIQEKVEMDTPFGPPSSPVLEGFISQVPVSMISRHGPGHRIMPGNVNFRANIRALLERGCTHVIATTACGSLREEIEPGFLVLPDQFIDRTTRRTATFYDRNEQVCHIAMENPFCPNLRDHLAGAITDLGFPLARDKTVVTIEGPRFSTQAESRMFRAWGADIINMSTVPEVVLAREAGLCYQAVAMSTDYDCFMKSKHNVTWEQIVKVMTENVEKVTQTIARAVTGVLDLPGDCGCSKAVDTALV